MKLHHYAAKTVWTGNKGVGTSGYTTYGREHELSAANKSEVILGSSDPAFRGDATRYNPEELLVSALSACHMLWYLHLCAVNKVVVVAYTDDASGKMSEEADGSGRFSEVTLNPEVTVADAEMTALALELHVQAHKMCYIANGCNFPIRHKPTVKTVQK